MDEFPRLEQSQVRGALGLFLFTGDDVFDAHCHALRRRERVAWR